MAKLRLFAPYSVFCRLDRNATETLTSYELLDFLKEQGVIDVSLGDCARLLAFFDSDNDGKLSFADFSQMILPCEEPGLRASAMHRKYSRVGRFDTLDMDVEMSLVRLM